MITRTNNIQSKNTFGVKFDAKKAKIDPRLSDSSQEYIKNLLKEIGAHNRRVAQNPLANQDVVELAGINLLPRHRHIVDTTETLGIHVKQKKQLIDPHTEFWATTSKKPQENIQNLSDYWDKITDFVPRKAPKK